MVLAVVSVAALPEVFWLPVVFTPGRSMLALPLNETPPMVLAVCRVVAVLALPVTAPVTLPSRLATNVPVVMVRLPVDAPVNVPVPILNLSSDSSKPMNALFESPRSITRPASLAGAPVVPLPSSISESDTTVLVVATVVVVPLTVKSPVTTTLPLKVALVSFMVTSVLPSAVMVIEPVPESDTVTLEFPSDIELVDTDDTWLST